MGKDGDDNKTVANDPGDWTPFREACIRPGICSGIRAGVAAGIWAGLFAGITAVREALTVANMYRDVESAGTEKGRAKRVAASRSIVADAASFSVITAIEVSVPGCPAGGMAGMIAGREATIVAGNGSVSPGCLAFGMVGGMTGIPPIIPPVIPPVG
jgi:hypothetical protein